MLGIIVQIILSLIILRIVVKKDLTALGIKPFGTRCLQFLIGFTFTAILCASIQLIDAILTNTNWEVSSKLTLKQGLNAFWLNVKGVLFEELIFRGAILFIIIHKFGAKIGMLISAVAFGIYHWFSYGVLGDIGSMTVVFFITAISGLVWAYAFIKTKSIALPIGLHLGWNFTFNSIFSKGPWGEQILVPDKVEFISNPILNLVVYFVLPYVVVPIFTWLLIRFYGRKNIESNKVFIT